MLVGCGASLMKTLGSRTSCQSGQSFLKTVLRCEIWMILLLSLSPFTVIRLALYSKGFSCSFFLSLLYPSQAFSPISLWCVYSFLGIYFSEDCNEHILVRECLVSFLASFSLSHTFCLFIVLFSENACAMDINQCCAQKSSWFVHISSVPHAALGSRNP